MGGIVRSRKVELDLRDLAASYNLMLEYMQSIYEEPENMLTVSYATLSELKATGWQLNNAIKINED